ncbi:lyase [Rhodohalobacter sp. SW132]|uniref:Vgb family protein n=1 Tax=Rhodohalobacter sp. SW132 TaxID=2293433 RepID=UPI000E23D456|nr:lyase [Rhodohalobacter sp. SW132]REL38985.1 lyase [Rhodohalobacter sp. SW132]
MKHVSALITFLVIVYSFTTGHDNIDKSSDTELVSDVILSVDEWKVPFDDTRSRDPYVAPDGTVYFAGQRAHYVGHFNPETEEFREFPLEDGAGPHTVVVADDGTVWYAGNRARHIGKMDPETGEITKYMMDDDYARDPHTFAFDKDGNIWFTAQGGNGVGHFNVETGESQIIPVPTERSRPYGIRMSPDKERPWIALFGTNKIATVDPETMELTEIELPRDEIRPRRLDVTSDGNVWYGDYADGIIGRYNPEDGSFQEWDMPDGSSSQPYAVLADDKDRIWFSASGLEPNKLVAFDTRTEEFVASREIESASGSIRHMDYDERTRSLWFGTDTGHIGRLVVN